MRGYVFRIGTREYFLINELAYRGFSARYIANRVFGQAVDDDSDEAVRNRQTISKHLQRQGIRLRDWRDGVTTLAKKTANEIEKAVRHRAPRRSKRRRAG